MVQHAARHGSTTCTHCTSHGSLWRQALTGIAMGQPQGHSESYMTPYKICVQKEGGGNPDWTRLCLADKVETYVSLW